MLYNYHTQEPISKYSMFGIIKNQFIDGSVRKLVIVSKYNKIKTPIKKLIKPQEPI